MSKQFVNDVVSIAILATCWHEVPMPPLEGEVPNEREAEGFVRKLSKKTPQSARSGCQLPFQGSQGGFAARVARLATPTLLILLTMRSYIFNSCNRRAQIIGFQFLVLAGSHKMAMSPNEAQGTHPFHTSL